MLSCSTIKTRRPMVKGINMSMKVGSSLVSLRIENGTKQNPQKYRTTQSLVGKWTPACCGSNLRRKTSMLVYPSRIGSDLSLSSWSILSGSKWLPPMRVCVGLVSRIVATLRAESTWIPRLGSTMNHVLDFMESSDWPLSLGFCQPTAWLDPRF